MLENETAKAFLFADKAVKRTEAITGEVSLPAINELRYAGYHIARSMSDESDEHRKKDELKRARSHCMRAWKDAYELGALYLLEQIDAIVQGYRGNWNQASQSLPEVVKYLEKVQEIKERLVQLKIGQEFDIEKYEQLFSDLSEIHKKLYALAPLAEIEVVEAKLRRLSKIRSAIAIIVGAVSLIVALISFFMGGK